MRKPMKTRRRLAPPTWSGHAPTDWHVTLVLALLALILLGGVL